MVMVYLRRFFNFFVRASLMIVLQPFCDCYTEVLLPFIADFWDVHHAEFSLETCRGILRDWTKAENCFFVIMRNDAAVGFLRTHNSSPTVCWIDDIYVDAAQRGRALPAKQFDRWKSGCSPMAATAFAWR